MFPPVVSILFDAFTNVVSTTPFTFIEPPNTALPTLSLPNEPVEAPEPLTVPTESTEKLSASIVIGLFPAMVVAWILPNEPVEVAEPLMFPVILKSPDEVILCNTALEPDVMTFFQDGMITPIVVGYSLEPTYHRCQTTGQH